MDKKEYFKLVRELTKTLKDDFGLDYVRVFSDKRKKAGYRTKFFSVQLDHARIERILAHIKHHTPFYGALIRPGAPWGSPSYSIIITPGFDIER